MTKYCKLSKHTVQKITNSLQNTLRCYDWDKKCFFFLSEKCSSEIEVPQPAINFWCFTLVVLSSINYLSNLVCVWCFPPGWPRRWQRRGATVHVGSLPGPSQPPRAPPRVFIHHGTAAGLVFLHKVSLIPARGSHTTAGIPARTLH